MNVRLRYWMLPTWGFVLIILVSSAILFAAINYQKNPLYWLAYASVAMIIIGSLYTVWWSRQFLWVWDVPSYAFRGFTWTLNANGPDVHGTFHSKSNLVSCYPLEVQVNKVGPLKLETPTWTTQYPFGLYNLRYTLPVIPEVWVYPSPLNHHETEEVTQQEPEYVNVRSFVRGDSIKLLLKRTQSLPPKWWQARSSEQEHTSSSEEKIQTLSWDDLPEDWSPQQKIEQLTFDVLQMNPGQRFALTLPEITLGHDSGPEHQHAAWKLLSKEWMRLPPSP